MICCSINPVAASRSDRHLVLHLWLYGVVVEF
jgi:hypothetical protein